MTGAIDSYSTHADSLGSRWLYIRLPECDTQQKRATARKARIAQRETLRVAARTLVHDVVRKARAHLPHAAPSKSSKLSASSSANAPVPNRWDDRRDRRACSWQLTPNEDGQLIKNIFALRAEDKDKQVFQNV